MRKLFTALLLGLWAFTTQATVVIYSVKLAETKTGGGRIVKTSFTGYLIIQADTGDVALITLEKKRGRFSVVIPDDYVLDNVSSGLNRESLVLLINAPGGGALAANGRNYRTDLFANDIYNVPKVMTVSGAGLGTEDETTLYQYKGSFRYSRRDTSDANVFSPTLDAAVENARENLTNKGYVEED